MTEKHQTAPDKCLWEYIGPGTGWVVVESECGGDCPEPAVEDPYVGQKELTACRSHAAAQSR